MVYRVYADGRPDELVRGVDIVGTPLLSLNNIVLTGDTLQVFNGVCGAESGQVPVAAAAPAMLFTEIEVQKRRRGTERPPILPPPGFEQCHSERSRNASPERRRANRSSVHTPRAAALAPRTLRMLALFPGRCCSRHPRANATKIYRQLPLRHASAEFNPILCSRPCAKSWTATNPSSRWTMFPRPTTSNIASPTWTNSAPKLPSAPLRQDQRTHGRSLRVVVRVGDYKQDSYYGPGHRRREFRSARRRFRRSPPRFLAATDRAYKMPTKHSPSKKAVLSQYIADQPFDDFARAPRWNPSARLSNSIFRPRPGRKRWKKSPISIAAMRKSSPSLRT